MTVLQKWQRFLEILENIPEEQFTMDIWWCGTMGCLAGHAAREEPRFGLELIVLNTMDVNGGRILIHQGNPPRKTLLHTESNTFNTDALMEVFEGKVRESDILHIFDPDSYGRRIDNQPLPPITKNRVANRLREMINEYS